MASTYPTTLDAFTNPLSTDLLTSPSHAQQHADINDAMEAVQTKLAIGNTVIGEYTAYTPTAIAWTIGNGTWSAFYARVNNLVHVYGTFTFGSTSVSGPLILGNLPVNIDADMISSGGGGADWVLGNCSFTDVSAGSYFFGYASSNAATQLRLHITTTASTYAGKASPSATVPFTWTTGDSFRFSVIYEAA
jgi:hypothetical protein